MVGILGDVLEEAGNRMVTRPEPALHKGVVNRPFTASIYR